MNDFIGPFLGFSIGGIHSSELKIVRVSSGDRYEQNLLPEFKDRTVEIPGGNGSYYFGSNYTDKKFTIDFAFDSLTEHEIRKLTKVLSFQGLQPLVFDETPYKRYMVKCSQPPQLKYICFEGNNYVDIYKGEGTLNLVSYYPFALGETHRFIGHSVNDLNLINSGDLESDNFKMFVLVLPTNPPANLFSVFMEAGNKKLDIDISDLRNKTWFVIDFKQQLILEVSVEDDTNPFAYETTCICNNRIIEGNFFKIPLGPCSLRTYLGDGSLRQANQNSIIEYNFLYY